MSLRELDMRGRTAMISIDLEAYMTQQRIGRIRALIFKEEEILSSVTEECKTLTIMETTIKTTMDMKITDKIYVHNRIINK